MTVEILYTAGCPHVASAVKLVQRALAEAGATGSVQTVEVTEDRLQSNRNFAGSPTILVNGQDVEPAQSTGLACRIYSNGTGCPSLEAVRRALERAMTEQAAR